MKKVLKFFYYKLRLASPLLHYLIAYKRASDQILSTCNVPAGGKTRDQLFNDFLATWDSKNCLQIGVKEDFGEKFGPNWVSVDKYDQRDFIDFHYDIQDLEFEDASFSAIVCWSILEHIPYPLKAISELYRVLEPGGEIWVQLPFLYPYHEAPKDYWRVTPDGLRTWMADFNEVSCGCDFWAGTSMVGATFFHGVKQPLYD